jgi:hypothetical protein
MSCNASTQTLLRCIRSVCQAAASHVLAINSVRNAAQALADALAAAQSRLACILTGATGTYCDGTPSLATKIDSLNAATIAGISVETATATAGQTTWTLSAAPAGLAYVQVAINGATLGPGDYSLTVDEIGFTDPVAEDDALTAWTFAI